MILHLKELSCSISAPVSLQASERFLSIGKKDKSTLKDQGYFLCFC